MPIVACFVAKSTLTASTPGADLRAASAFGAHVCHVMPSIVITVRSMSAVNSSLAVSKLVKACGKNKKTTATTVTPHSRTLLKVMMFERGLAVIVADWPLLSAAVAGVRRGR